MDKFHLDEWQWHILTPLRVLKELTDGIAKPFFVFEKSWQSGGAPGGWKRGNNTPVFKKGRKEDSGDPQPASLTSVPEIMEQLLLEGLMKHMEDRGVIWQSLPDQPMAFYDGVDNGRATEVIYPGTIPHSILLSKLERDDFRGELLDGEGSGWMAIQRVVVSGSGQCPYGQQWQEVSLRDPYWDWCYFVSSLMTQMEEATKMIRGM